eukprot:m.125212 g.125212  ORF g.125212 m.125212 type:complete len:202 (+) comp22114_c0_seq1:256-861(+)
MRSLSNSNTSYVMASAEPEWHAPAEEESDDSMMVEDIEYRGARLGRGWSNKMSPPVSPRTFGGPCGSTASKSISPLRRQEKRSWRNQGSNAWLARKGGSSRCTDFDAQSHADVQAHFDAHQCDSFESTSTLGTSPVSRSTDNGIPTPLRQDSPSSPRRKTFSQLDLDMAFQTNAALEKLSSFDFGSPESSSWGMNTEGGYR